MWHGCEGAVYIHGDSVVVTDREVSCGSLSYVTNGLYKEMLKKSELRNE